MIKQLGRYETICEIGQGAMGLVYKAMDPLIDRVVAIKTINLKLALEEKEEYEGRFYQEAKAAGRLAHPNIVTIFDVGKSGDVAYIAMEFLQGRELRDILNDGKLLPVNQVLDIVAQVAQGLSYAHEHQIVHRDIKPANIMIVRDGLVKITDFGIARMPFSSIQTQIGMVLGSPKYMSPEQVRGLTVDSRSDIFSLGVMLYEMLTGKCPFDGDDVNAIMYQTLKATPVPPCTVNPALPEVINFIVAKALAKNLEDRYQNARDFALDLRECRESLLFGKKQSYDSATVETKKVSDIVVSSGQLHREEEESLHTTGLSPVFDSTGAIMRLASLTGSSEDVDELARTLKKPGSKDKVPTQAPTMHRDSRLMLIAFVILVLLSIVAILVV
jgi:serine/threonine-protein kinase